MTWLPLNPLDLPGLAAETINRRIATHLELRAEVDADQFKSTRKTTRAKAILETLSRELFIRRDTINLLQLKNLSTTEAEAAFAAVHQQLREAE